MQRNTLFSILATAALGIVVAGPVSAQTTYRWIGAGSDDYHTAANWNPTGVPGTGDKANIKPFSQPENYMNPVLDDQDRSLGELVIGSGFSLTVTGVKLTLDGTITHDIDGDLVLSNSTAVVKFSASVTAGGDGAIVGQNNGAKIQIKGGTTLISTMLIQGQMIIKTDGGTGNGTFNNGSTGIVRANGTATAPAILVFAAGLTITDEDGASYEAKTDPDAVLQFDVGASCIKGDFLIDNCATIKVANNVTIKTEGGLTHTAGRLTIGSSATFAYDCNAGCSNCQTTVTTSRCVGSCNCP